MENEDLILKHNSQSGTGWNPNTMVFFKEPLEPKIADVNGLPFDTEGYTRVKNIKSKLS
jgi:hypothetical protein